MKRFYVCLLMMWFAGCSTVSTGNSVYVQDIADKGPPADFTVDDFEDEELSWWTYLDENGSAISLTVGEQGGVNGKFLVIDPDIKAHGYGGVETEFSEALRLEGSRGIILDIKTGTPSIPLNIVVWMRDPAQDSPLVNHKTPFKFKFETKAGSVKKWERYVLPWKGFERSTWVGQGGSKTLDTGKIIGMEIAFENENSDLDITGEIFVDNIKVLIDKAQLAENKPDKIKEKYNPVKVNQAGFFPDGKKVFYSSRAAWKFELRDAESGEIVYSGPMKYLGFDKDSGMDIYAGDFSSFKDPGRYRISAVGAGESYPFVISRDVYRKPLKLAVRFFYYQRSGTDIILDFDGNRILKKGHTGEAELWDDHSVKMDVSGGWYDAGDYGRYIPTAAFSVNQLLYAFDFNPDCIGPGVLDEVRYEVEWMLKMQREDGAVYHKVTTKNYPEMGMPPSADRQQLYLFGPTTSDTAYFAAAVARSAVTFSRIDKSFSDRCAKAAVKSFRWLLAHPGQIPSGGFKNPPVSKYPMQGGYDFIGSENHSRMWAAAEIYRMNGSRKALESFSRLYKKSGNESGFIKMDWSDPYGLALYAYIQGSSGDDLLRKSVLDQFHDQADMIIKTAERSLFKVSLDGRSGSFAYVWGSNQVVSANGVELAMAYEIFRDEKYRTAAEDQMNYLLGENGLSKMFMSGMGGNPVRNPHHNLSIYLGSAVPGIVGEGPNGAVSEGSGGDAVLSRLWKAKTPPALCYEDSSESWATNEPTIDANASFTALLSFLCR